MRQKIKMFSTEFGFLLLFTLARSLSRIISRKERWTPNSDLENS